MRILWLSWKDMHHPQAGGAEVVTSELLKRLVNSGHEVILLTSNYPGARPKSTIDGYSVIRVGGRVTVYWQAFIYIRRHLANWPDRVIEEINTMPFCTKLYMPGKSRLLFFHMLCREIWFYQMIFPLSYVGYVVEIIYLKFLSSERAIAMSDSTKQDLVRHGFSGKNITVISEGIQIDPILKLLPDPKFAKPTILSLGSLRYMKRTLDQVRAFERAKVSIPDLQMKVAGDTSGSYGKKVLAAIADSRYSKDIEVLGRITVEEKSELLLKSHLITVTSIKEGWGLIVTEAASQGTPAAVYDVDGLRDSVKHNKTGTVCSSNTPENLAQNIVALLSDTQHYQALRENAWQWSKSINFDTSYQQFKQEVRA